MLEELKELYGTAFTTTIVDFRAGEQKSEWFLRLNYNGPLLHYSFPSYVLLANPFFSYLFCGRFLTMREVSMIVGTIPALVDNNQNPPYTVLESAAQILYLSEIYDKNFELSFKDPIERSDAYQWLLFWHGSGAPNLQNWAHFSIVSPERNPGMYCTYICFLYKYMPNPDELF